MSVPCCSSLPSHFQWIHRNLCCFLPDIPLPSLHLLIPPPLFFVSLPHIISSLTSPSSFCSLSLPSFLHAFSLLCFSSLLPFTFSPDYLFPSLFPFHSLQSFLSPLFSPLSILIFLLLRHSYHQSPLPSSACHPHLFYLPRIYRFLSHKTSPLTQSFVGRHSLSSFVPTQFLLARQHVQHTQSVQTT